MSLVEQALGQVVERERAVEALEASRREVLRDDLSVECLGFREPVLAREHLGEVVRDRAAQQMIGRKTLGQGCEALAQGLFGFGHAAEGIQREAEVVECLGEARVASPPDGAFALDELGEECGRVGVASEIGQHRREGHQRVARALGLARQRVLAARDEFGADLQRLAEGAVDAQHRDLGLHEIEREFG